MSTVDNSNLTLIETANGTAKLPRTAQPGAERYYSPASFAGHSPAAQRLRELIGKLTQVSFSALTVSGETGTGKGLAVKILHYGGARANGPLVEINCAALPKELLESELFGHELGAFTGARERRRGLIEQASGGTLFLDEIGELSLDLQSKLLKAIEDKAVRRLGGNSEIPVDVQIVAATNRDLKICARAGAFRSDLYYRLSVFDLMLPPLRTRKEDLEDLVPVLLAEYNAKAGKHVSIVPPDVWQQLYDYHWPGNVRELRNVIERCVLLSDDSVFPSQWLQLDVEGTAPAASAPMLGINCVHLPLDGSMALEEMDRYIIKTALERHRYNILATARALGTTRETLRYRVQKYDLKIPADQGKFSAR